MQPINTGFSYSNDERDRVYDEKVVAADMLDFLSEFREAHPSYFSSNDLYVTGESYGGALWELKAYRQVCERS